MLFHLMTDNKGAAILELIKNRAVERWGDSWLAQITHAYVELEGEKATFVNRRPQIGRAFETGGCNLETAVRLADCIGCEIQLSCTEIKTTILKVQAIRDHLSG
jgi:hypothetical protein